MKKKDGLKQQGPKRYRKTSQKDGGPSGPLEKRKELEAVPLVI
jgi:hypothetical protein